MFRYVQHLVQICHKCHFWSKWQNDDFDDFGIFVILVIFMDHFLGIFNDLGPYMSDVSKYVTKSLFRHFHFLTHFDINVTCLEIAFNVSVCASLKQQMLSLDCCTYPECVQKWLLVKMTKMTIWRFWHICDFGDIYGSFPRAFSMIWDHICQISPNWRKMLLCPIFRLFCFFDDMCNNPEIAFVVSKYVQHRNTTKQQMLSHDITTDAITITLKA